MGMADAPPKLWRSFVLNEGLLYRWNELHRFVGDKSRFDLAPTLLDRLPWPLEGKRPTWVHAGRVYAPTAHLLDHCSRPWRRFSLWRYCASESRERCLGPGGTHAVEAR